MSTLLHRIHQISSLPVALVGITGIFLGTSLAFSHLAAGVPGGWNTVLAGFIGPVSVWMACAWLAKE